MNNSLCLPCALEASELCDKSGSWRPASLFPFDLVTSLLPEAAKEETIASKCSSSVISEISLTIFSRSTVSRSTFAILVEQELHRITPALLTSPCSSKWLWPKLIAVHSDGMHTPWRARISPEPEQKLTAKGSNRLFSNQSCFWPPQVTTKTKRDIGKTLISLLDFSLSPLYSSPLSFLPWPIFTFIGPSHQASCFRYASKLLQNTTLEMFIFSDLNGRGHRFGWDATSIRWVYGDILFTLIQSSAIATPPKAYFHRISLMARDPILGDFGPSDAPFPVKASTVHGAKLFGREVSGYYSLLPRSILIYRLNLSFVWLIRYKAWNGRGLCSSIVSTSAPRSFDYHLSDLKQLLFLNTTRIHLSATPREVLVHGISWSANSPIVVEFGQVYAPFPVILLKVHNIRIFWRLVHNIRICRKTEATWVLKAVDETLANRFTIISIASDSQKLIKAIISKSPSVELHGILHDILQLISRFSSISFKFIPRKSNCKADSLAKEALNLCNRDWALAH